MFKNSIIVSLLLVSSSVLGFIAQLVFVSTFGASVEMDIYFAVLSVPSIITGMAPMVFSSVLIPIFAKLKSNQLEREVFINSVWSLVLLFAVVFFIFGLVISVINLNVFIPEKHIYLRKMTFELIVMIWIGAVFSLISSYLSAILNYTKQFFKVAWTANLPSFFMIIIVLLFHKSLGVRSISLGFSLAFICQFFIFLRASPITIKSFNYRFKQLRYKKLLLNQTLLVILSLLPFTLLAPIGFFWASRLDDGSSSLLGYSQSFAGFLSVAVGMGIAIVSFTDLADNFANGKGESSLREFEQILRYILLISFFSAGLLIGLRVPLFTLFYQRGSFDGESIDNLARVVPWYLISAVFMSGLNLLRTLFYSRGQFKYIAVLGLSIPIIFFVLAGVLKEKYSFVGIGIANALSFAILFFTTIYLAKEEDISFLTDNFMTFIIKVITVNLISGICASLYFPYLSNYFNHITSILGFCVLFFSTYFILAKYIIKLKEVGIIGLMVINKFKTLINS